MKRKRKVGETKQGNSLSTLLSSEGDRLCVCVVSIYTQTLHSIVNSRPGYGCTSQGLNPSLGSQCTYTASQLFIVPVR